MYNTHAPLIKDFAASSADNLTDVVLMVVLSIQQNWLSVGDQLKDVKVNGIESKFLWGFKRDTYIWLERNKHKLYGQYRAVLNSTKDSESKADSMMKVFMRVPGLGLVKAGFACQLAGGLVGCIDSHNIKLYSIEPSVLKVSNKMNPDTLAEKRKKYIKLCHLIGTENLWNNWCNHLATKSKLWDDAHHVSEVHYKYLVNLGA